MKNSLSAPTKALLNAFSGGLMFLGIAAMLLFALPRFAKAQTYNATVVGVVTDQSGSAIPDSTVTARNLQTDIVQTVRTDGTGRFHVRNLPPGFYTIEAKEAGFATAIVNSVQLFVGTTVTMNFNLKVSAVNSVVEVTARPPGVDVTQSMLAKVIDPTTLDDFPSVSRSFSDLASLSPGVLIVPTASPKNNDNGIYIGGARTYQTGYALDGINIQDTEIGNTVLKLPQDWIQEFSLISANQPAEYGGASAGVVNAVTRSGTNALHGRVYGFYQNQELNATPAFVAKKIPAYQRRFGGMIGGPIIKNKLFYFVGYEDWYNQSNVGVSVPAAFVNPAALTTSGTFLATASTKSAMAKLNYAINDKNTVWARWNYEFDRQTNNNVNKITPISDGDYHVTGPIDDFSGDWAWVASSKTLNDVRAAYYRWLPDDVENCLSYLGSYPGGGATANSAGNPIGYWATLAYANADVYGRCASRMGAQGGNETHIVDQLSHISGRHQLKFGGDLHRWQYMAPAPGLLNQLNPSVTLIGSQPFPFDLDEENPKLVLPISYSANYQRSPVGGPDHTNGQIGDIYFMRGYEFGWFAEDSFQARPNLTFNIGLRYDIDLAGNAVKPYVPAGHNGMKNTYNLFAPRFGIAWSPLKNHTFVIRGGIGLFSDKDTWNIEGAWISDAAFSVQDFNLSASNPSLNPYCFGNNSCKSGIVPTLDQYYVAYEIAKALSNYTLPTFPAPGTTDTVTVGAKTSSPSTLVIPAPTFTWEGGQQLPSPTGNTYDFGPNLTVPQEIQETVGAAAELHKNLDVAADFVYVRGFNDYVVTDVNVNPITFQRPINPAYIEDLQWNNGGLFKNYSLRTQMTYRSHRGDIVHLAYTLGYAYDNTVNGFNPGTSSAGQNPLNPMTDWGVSAVDVRHILSTAAVTHIPWGITFSPVFSFASPLPYSASTTTGVAGCPSYYTFCYPAGYSKNSLRGADTILFNARLEKTFHFEKVNFSIFDETYNILNIANHGTAFNATVTSKSFGQPQGIISPMRQFQFGGRIDF